MGVNNRIPIVTNGLVLYLDAANRNSYTSGSTTWRDVSLNNNNGILVNGPSFNSANGGSIAFDGVNDYVNCGNPNILDFNNQKNMTVSSWIYPTNNVNSNANIISKAFQWYTNFNSDRTIRVGFYKDSSTFQFFYSNSALSLNQWHNITWTYNGSNIILYVNSVLDKSIVETSNLSYGQGINCNVLIGAEANFCLSSETRYFQGRINNAQVYNRALPVSEVLQNYNAQKARFGL